MRSGCECRRVVKVGTPRRLVTRCGNGNLIFEVVELLHWSTASVGGGDALDLNKGGDVSAKCYLDDLNAVGLCTVTSSHLAVSLSDCSGAADVTVLAIHVVMTGAGVVTQPNSEVLHAAFVLLEHLNAEHEPTGRGLPPGTGRSRLGSS